MADCAPLVSVLIPTFDRPELLMQALRSVTTQTYANMEILIQDNGSDINTEKVIADFDDPRISFRRNAKNLGMALNWRALSLRARGKYVAFLNDDDTWESDFVSTMVEILEERPDLILAFCDHWLMDADGRIDPAATSANSRRWMRSRIAEGEHKPFTEIALVYRSIWTASAALFRRDAIDWEAIPRAAGVMVDVYLAYLAARTGRGAWYCNKRLARYRLHDGSTTASFGALASRTRCAEDAVFCWNAFAADKSVRAGSPYFHIKLLHNRFRHGLCRWRQGTPNFAPFAILRLLSPEVCAWHFRYMMRLRRIKV